MKLYAPNYEKSFVCIADQCKHSCCVGWEIDIDPDTLQRYQQLNHGYADSIRGSIDHTGDAPCFSLCDNQKCPHLDERGLCRIITNIGEDYLCDICREHPRFYHDTPLGKEVGYGMACEEACRIILTSDSYADIRPIGEMEGGCQDFDFDPLPYRTEIFAILQDTHLTYPQKAQKIQNTYGVSLDSVDALAILEELSYLDEQNKTRFEVYAPHASLPSLWDAILTRALAYFVYRHVSVADSESDLSASLGFGLFCVQLMISIAVSQKIDDTEEFVEVARAVSEELEYNEDNTQEIKLAFLFA